MVPPPSCLPHLPPPSFLTREEGTCTEWTAHNCFGTPQITTGLTHTSRGQGRRGEKNSLRILILLSNPCVIKMNALLRELWRGMTLASIGVIIAFESSATARGESLCFSCCRQSISARGKHSTPLLLSAEEL